MVTHKLVHAHLQALTSLSNPNNTLAALQFFHDSVEGHVRSLESLRTPHDQYESMLVPIRNCHQRLAKTSLEDTATHSGPWLNYRSHLAGSMCFRGGDRLFYSTRQSTHTSCLICCWGSCWHWAAFPQEVQGTSDMTWLCLLQRITCTLQLCLSHSVWRLSDKICCVSIAWVTIKSSNTNPNSIVDNAIELCHLWYLW